MVRSGKTKCFLRDIGASVDHLAIVACLTNGGHVGTFDEFCVLEA